MFIEQKRFHLLSVKSFSSETLAMPKILWNTIFKFHFICTDEAEQMVRKIFGD